MDIEKLKLLLDYDVEKGVLTWKARSREHFVSDWSWKVWNKKHAGKTAGNAVGSDGFGRNNYVIVKALGSRVKVHRLIWALHYGGPVPVIDQTSTVTVTTTASRTCAGCRWTKTTATRSSGKTALAGLSASTH